VLGKRWVGGVPAAGRLKLPIALTWMPAMPLFWKPYTSDVTQFINDLKAKKPTLEAEQRAGRALLWDKQIDRSAQANFEDAEVPQTPYVYFPKPAKL
jgi:hypothetical protein